MAKKAAATKAPAPEINKASEKPPGIEVRTPDREIESEEPSGEEAKHSAADENVTVHDDILDALRSKASYPAAEVAMASFPPQGVKEDDKSYFLRMFDAVSKLTDEAYDSLDAPSQEWLGEAMTAAGESRAFPPPQGFESKFGGTAASRVNLSAGAFKAPKADKPPKAEKAPKAAKEPKPPKDGLVAKARRLVLLNLDKSLKDIAAMPDAAAYNRGTLGVQYGWAHGMIRELRDLGFTVTPPKG